MCVGVRKFTSVDNGGAWSFPGPTISEDPENPENEEPSLKFSRDTVMVVLFLGKYESTDTSAFGIDKNFLKEFLVVHKEHSAQTHIGWVSRIACANGGYGKKCYLNTALLANIGILYFLIFTLACS